MADGHLSEVDGGPLRGRHSSLFEYFEPRLNDDSDNTALIVMHQPRDYLAGLISDEGNRTLSTTTTAKATDRYLTWTYRQLHLGSVRLANALLASGIQPGKSTLISLLPNGVEYTLLLWTCLLLKVTIGFLDAGALQPAREAELEAFLNSLKPDAIVVPHSQGAVAVDQVLARFSNLHMPKARIIATPLTSDLSPPVGWSTLLEYAMRGNKNQLKTDAELVEESHHDDLDRVAVIMFTSGTSTGQPKGVPRTVLNLIHRTELKLPFATSTAVLHSANFRAIALSVTMAVWQGGGSTIMPSDGFDPETTLAAIEHCKASFFIIVPFQLHALVDHPSFTSTDLSSLKILYLAGDIITRDLLDKTERAFTHAESVRSAYGMTEGAGCVGGGGKLDTAQRPYFEGIASVGRVAPGSRMKVVDVETGEVVARSVPGELHVRCDAYITGYLGGVRPETFYHDGYGTWFRTGDQATITDEGDLFILGRIKDIIKRAGIPISPTAIEKCIGTRTGTQCTVFGIRHATLGQEIFAVVRTYGATDEEQLKQDVINAFGKDYALRGTASLAQLGLDDFPQNATGKVMKMELEALVVGYLRSRSGTYVS